MLRPWQVSEKDWTFISVVLKGLKKERKQNSGKHINSWPKAPVLVCCWQQRNRLNAPCLLCMSGLVFLRLCCTEPVWLVVICEKRRTELDSQPRRSLQSMREKKQFFLWAEFIIYWGLLTSCMCCSHIPKHFLKASLFSINYQTAICSGGRQLPIQIYEKLRRTFWEKETQQNTF